jgi:hypothetical protein
LLLSGQKDSSGSDKSPGIQEIEKDPEIKSAVLWACGPLETLHKMLKRSVMVQRWLWAHKQGMKTEQT